MIDGTFLWDPPQSFLLAFVLLDSPLLLLISDPLNTALLQVNLSYSIGSN